MHSKTEQDGCNGVGLWERFVRFGFRLLYHELAWSYDLIASLVSLGEWHTWRLTALDYLVGPRVLELGHGPGHLLTAMVTSGFRPVGLDLSHQMGRMARRRLHRSGFELSLVRAPAQSLPFPDNTFDSVVATFPTAFIVDPATLVGIARVLRPHGRLIIIAGARLKGRRPLTQFIEWLYLITGQRETIDAGFRKAQFATAGLSLRQVQVDLKRSQVFLLLAQRVDSNSGDKD